MKTKSITLLFRLFNALVLFALLFGATGTTPALAASQVNITGPAGSGSFGSQVTVLPNGNFIVVDQGYDAGAVVDAGAVYLYNGSTHALISTLTGSATSDHIGSSIKILANGNYLIVSNQWDNGVLSDAGAVTWGSATTGVSGVISAANSLVGSAANEGTIIGITILTNGNYVVTDSTWDNGVATNAGAVTWGNGTTGISGTRSAVNSLVGASAGEDVGTFVVALTNGNYVVASPKWDNGFNTDAGAVTWVNGTTGLTGVISTANSLYGTTSNDNVGGTGIKALKNGNYVVLSSNWSNFSTMRFNVGAATWGNGATGITGAVSPSNSLVGTTATDQVSKNGAFVALANGNYVIGSPYWDNGSTTDVGAATWGNGATGSSGPVAAANSLIGSTTADYVGGYITALTNGNYVAASPFWDNGSIVEAGAVTWGNGVSGQVGIVSAANSLVGTTANDSLANFGVHALSNGNYVVGSVSWDNGSIVDAGAATWASGTSGLAGTISAANSLVGATAGDSVGYRVVSLTNGNYVASTEFWDNGAIANVGAVTWGNGSTGISGVVSASNSLIGSTDSDLVGSSSSDGVIALSDGNYMVSSPFWDNGALVNAGAATWANGSTGLIGVVSLSNSLFGTSAFDTVSFSNSGMKAVALANGKVIIYSPSWDNGGTTNSGAVTLGSSSTVGAINSSNSVLGTASNGGGQLNADYDYVNDQLVVGRPADNMVTLMTTPPAVSSVARVSINPTNFSSVDFTVTFSESVTGVDAGDFILTTSGVSGAAVSGISGTGSVYTVTVSTGTGSGTIRLDVLNDGSIKDFSLNLLEAGFTSGETYQVRTTTFADVPTTYWAWQFIERLYKAGVTGGCGTSPLIYCPDSTVTRAQMAVFLLKGMHGSSFTPPAINGSTGFTDVATDHWAAAWIKQLAAEGITSGCGAGVYCPESTVTRAQMAVFLLKAKHGSSYTPPAATGIFSDVPLGYWADKWIERLAAEGVTSGCGAGIYCPDAEVTRAQMAVFLVKAFNLP